MKDVEEKYENKIQDLEDIINVQNIEILSIKNEMNILIPNSAKHSSERKNREDRSESREKLKNLFDKNKEKNNYYSTSNTNQAKLKAVNYSGDEETYSYLREIEVRSEEIKKNRDRIRDRQRDKNDKR